MFSMVCTSSGRSWAGDGCPELHAKGSQARLNTSNPAASRSTRPEAPACAAMVGRQTRQMKNARNASGQRRRFGRITGLSSGDLGRASGGPHSIVTLLLFSSGVQPCPGGFASVLRNPGQTDQKPDEHYYRATEVRIAEVEIEGKPGHPPLPREGSQSRRHTRGRSGIQKGSLEQEGLGALGRPARGRDRPGGALDRSRRLPTPPTIGGRAPP